MQGKFVKQTQGVILSGALFITRINSLCLHNVICILPLKPLLAGQQHTALGKSANMHATQFAMSCLVKGLPLAEQSTSTPLVVALNYWCT